MSPWLCAPVLEVVSNKEPSSEGHTGSRTTQGSHTSRTAKPEKQLLPRGGAWMMLGTLTMFF